MLRSLDMADTTESLREVRLPSHLCEAAEKLLKQSPFSSLEELLAFILEELAARDATPLDQQERSLIEQRLRDLGYL